MIRYPHFAFPNLNLLNGYKEVQTHRGLEREYVQEDDLEQCIRRLVLHKPERLRGWDLRFLRRGLGISQADLGAQVDRDPQTIARWEKSTDAIPSAVDLSIRARFAARFDPQISMREILSFIDGTARKLPTSIYLRLTSKGWQFELEPMVKFARISAYGRTLARLDPGVGPTYRLFDRQSEGKVVVLVVEPQSDGDLFFARVKSSDESLDAMERQSSQENTRQLNVNIKGSANDYTSATIH